MLAQYIAYHKPDWLVYTPDVQTHASMDSCTLQLVRLLGIARQEQIRLAVLVKTLKCSFVETFMEFVPWHGEHTVEIVTSVEQLMETVAGSGVGER